MRWYWGATISVVAGLIFTGAILASGIVDRVANSLRNPLLPWWLPPWLYHAPVTIIIFFAPPIIFSVLLYCCLTRFAGGPAQDAETRCRKCRYILRGISEPRCPECGERI